MILVPDRKRLARQILNIIEDCMGSAETRAIQAKQLKMLRYTGSIDGQSVIYNKMNGHINKLGAYLFSPAELRFFMEFEDDHEKNIYSMAAVAAKKLTRRIEARGIDKKFQMGVDTSLCYGAGLLKMSYGHNGLTARTVQPWNLGVFREDNGDLDEQEVICERIYITSQEFWRRISHLPDAKDLYKRGMSNSKKRAKSDDSTNFLNEVLLSMNGTPVNTDGNTSTNPGGFVNLANPSGLMLSPQMLTETVLLYELTILDDETQDYTTVQLVEPDILIAPHVAARKKNFFLEGEQPYNLIQADPMENYIWGRSELADLLTLQNFLSERLNDIRKLGTLQFERLLAFIGFSGMNDEKYDAFRENGFISQDDGGSAKVEDLTPKMPEDAWKEVEATVKMMDDVGGFGNILSGQGEPGVRAGNHAQTLMRTASPPLRDRALLIERQCAEMGDKAFRLLQAKDPKAYRTPDGKTEFLLSQIPDDVRVTVDSHSSSPIYEEDHLQLAAFLAKVHAITPEGILDMLNFPMKDTVKIQVKEAAAQQALMLQQHPELAHPAKHPKGG